MPVINNLLNGTKKDDGGFEHQCLKLARALPFKKNLFWIYLLIGGDSVYMSILLPVVSTEISRTGGLGTFD